MAAISVMLKGIFRNQWFVVSLGDYYDRSLATACDELRLVGEVPTYQLRELIFLPFPESTSSS